MEESKEKKTKVKEESDENMFVASIVCNNTRW